MFVAHVSHLLALANFFQLVVGRFLRLLDESMQCHQTAFVI
jgi:hypothetical protein